MKKGVSRGLQIGGAVVVVAAVVFGGLRWNHSRQYISTDDAYIDGQQYAIASPVGGKIIDWQGTVGATFAPNGTVGEVEEQSGDSTSTVSIPAPANVSIIQQDTADNEYVAAGTPLAYAYDMSKLWVTVNVKETLIHEVHVGEPVDISIDAYPGQTFHGQVARIGLATGDTLSVVPSSSNNANFTKVTQIVPVKVTFTTYPDEPIVPGFDVTAHIKKNG
ncbi:efflux RND transporter periplasmic adaptor subunit [Alicyclobacillus fastidiosus]|uniref:Efflux RND transporter periplasmic adaptor subunit n=1 Tax=Alicyclobacillus fastidiosus TaxID=392011 RepID=A0ABY6ZG01_9BACL|nr:efflux RND transporter periplasmic adaptor subunit [Alicyclobacillus fastidiosus]WAH41792.1 efflux RND transporter periplasmic adaptor subunit [Alicyclobacillus fastidiosus]GMA63487.1 multidrug resistance protein A [Alicyclobacillus fastidiosus]